MLDFSFGEILLVVTVAVVFLRPSDVPVVVRAVTKAVAQFKRLTRELRDAFHEVARESGVEEIQQDIRREMRAVTGEDGKEYVAYDIDDFLKKHDQPNS